MENLISHKKYAYVHLIAMLVVTCITQGCCASTRLQSITHLYQPTTQGLRHEKYITIHAAAHYQAGSNHQHSNIKIHIQRDQMIWFSATHPSGIELIRGRVTPDKIEIINHITRSYQILDYHNLALDWKIRLNYTLIEAMLLGELPPTEVATTRSKSNNKTVIQQEQTFWKLLATIDTYTQHLTSLTITDKVTLHKGSIFYTYKKGHAQHLLFCELKAYFAKFNLNLRYKKVTLLKQPLNCPFKIPAHYANQ